MGGGGEGEELTRNYGRGGEGKMQGKGCGRRKKESHMAHSVPSSKQWQWQWEDGMGGRGIERREVRMRRHAIVELEYKLGR